MIMKRILPFLVLLFATIGAYAYVGETFSYEGVQYRITREDPANQLFQIAVSRYDTIYVVIPDQVPYNNNFYQVTQTAPFLRANCLLRHYIKVDYSRALANFSPMTTFVSQYIDVDSLILPPHIYVIPPHYTIDTIDISKRIYSLRNDPLLAGIHRIFSTGTDSLFNNSGYGMSCVACGALQEIDFQSHPVEQIPSHAYLCCYYMEKATIPNSVRNIRDKAFCGNLRMTYVNIPDELESINNDPFGLIQMDTLRLGTKVKNVTGWSFEGWYNLKHIEVDPTNPWLTSDSGVLFTNTKRTLIRYPIGNIKSGYHIPAETDTIGFKAFSVGSDPVYHRYGDVESDSMMIKLKEYRDSGCLDTLYCNPGLKVIGVQAFANSNVHYVQPAEINGTIQVKELSLACFNMSSLRAFTISPTMEIIADKVFAICDSLYDVNFDRARNLKVLGKYALAYNPSLREVNLQGCTQLSVISEGLCKADSALIKLILPNKVNQIEQNAFQGCVSLKEIVCPSPSPIPIETSVFEGVNKNKCILYVPDMAVNMYKTTPVWEEFFQIMGNGMKGIVVESSDTTMGTVFGGGGYNSGDNITITATPKEGFEFVSWSDGNTDNPRTVTVTQDVSLTAIFQYTNYHIDARPNDSTLGYVTGGGLYHLHDSITLWAHPNEHGKFIEWSDGYKYSLRDWEVTGDTTLVAYFELFGDTTHTDTTVVRYTLTAVPNDSTMGFVVGGGEYAAGEDAYLTAVPYDGYCFREWDFTSRKEPSVTFVMTPFDATVTAYFEAIDDALPMTPADPADTDPDHTPYNILGQPVNETYHGIVIKNGQKRVQ